MDPLQRVPVTYIPVSMQQQSAANHRAVSGKPYERFFLPEIEVPVAGAKLLRAGPMPKEQTLTPSVGDLARLLDRASDFPDHGYALLDGPTAYAQSRVVMPGVTTAQMTSVGAERTACLLGEKPASRQAFAIKQNRRVLLPRSQGRKTHR